MTTDEKRKRGRANRLRGIRAEQEVGRILFEAWYGVKPDRDATDFRRTKPGVRQYEGDLTTPEGFPFRLSVKDVNDEPPPHHFLTGGKTLLRWWAEIREIADWTYQPCLIWKHRGVWFCAWKPYVQYYGHDGRRDVASFAAVSQVGDLEGGLEGGFFYFSTLKEFCKILRFERSRFFKSGEMVSEKVAAEG